MRTMVKKDKQRQVGVRLDESTFEAVEKHLDELRAKAEPGISVTLTDALRSLILRGLASSK